ncbi:MAG: adenine-specific methyltransferase EcoRI family protein [Patescibacteria group bacterium]|jgi:hypothetical protein
MSNPKKTKRASSPTTPSRPSGNRVLSDAKKAKQDEFYTQLVDIENELKYYKEQLRGMTIFCNCDDPFESYFFKYFALNFNELGLKKLIATSYVPSAIAGKQLPLLEIEGLKPDGKEPFKIEINAVPDANHDGATDLADVEYLLRHEANTATPIKGNGDFRSAECIELLKQADVVVTNPPFSLFREFVAQLVEHEKKFLIIGSNNAVKYNDIFKLIKENKVWLGVDNGGTKWFRVPDDYDIQTESRKKVIDGVKYFSMGSIVWFTNLDNPKRHEFITLYKKYTPEEYPKYDNYDAINVGKYTDIPTDYDGVMGVPITFLDKYNPAQFKILGIFDDKREKSDAFIQGEPTFVDKQHKKYVGPVLNGRALFTRILIINRKVKK